MRRVTVTRTDAEVPAKTPAPRPGPDAVVVGPDSILMCDDEPVAVYSTGAEVEASRLARQLRERQVTNSWPAKGFNPKTGQGNEGRLSGLSVAHAVFGWTPPVPLRQRWGGSLSELHRVRPDLIETLAGFVKFADDLLTVEAPAAAERTRQAIDARVPKAYRFAGSTWTSGIINNVTAHPYHRDSGNVKGSWSAMLGARRWCEGGMLHLVEYDVWLPIAHGTVTLFDGQAVMHGVSPLERQSPNAYRYTTVAYAKAGLSVCDPDPAREPARAQYAATVKDVKAQLP